MTIRRDRLGRFASGGAPKPPTATQNRHVPKRANTPDPTVMYDQLALTMLGHRISEHILKTHPTLSRLTHAVADAGGRPMLVGGAVRDRLLDRPGNDLDIEVLGMEQDRLESLLIQLSGGKVDLVGRQFAVYKLGDLDVALPRTETKTGSGHTGFTVHPDSTLTPAQAAQRRDFTINAISVDLAAGEMVDPAGGMRDLRNRYLRHVGPAFAEDPLRVLRGAQFCSRFGLTPDAETLALCRSLRDEMDSLPIERQTSEWHKMLTKGHAPSLGLDFLKEAGWLPPELPDSEVADAGAAANRARNTPLEGRERTVAIWAALSARLSDADARDLTFRLSQSKAEGWDAFHVRQLAFTFDHSVSDTNLRRLADRGRPLFTVIHAWAASRHEDPGPLLARANGLGILHRPEPHLINGDDLIRLGHEPGPMFKNAIEAVRAAQFNGTINTRDEAATYANNWFHQQNN